MSEILVVVGSSWLEEDVDDIRAVLTSASETLAPYFPEGALPTIEVSRSAEGHPRTLYERGPFGEVRVRLVADAPYWAQLAFQFGHELTHILCGYRNYVNPNMWFEEVVCEAASLFVLGQMAETWKARPPHLNWSDYAGALLAYREGRIQQADPFEGSPLADLLREHEASLPGNSQQGDLIVAMATRVLPLIEAEPEHWPAFATLNSVHGDGTRSFARYLRDWSGASPEVHREFIRQIAEPFGISFDDL